MWGLREVEAVTVKGALWATLPVESRRVRPREVPAGWLTVHVRDVPFCLPKSTRGVALGWPPGSRLYIEWCEWLKLNRACRRQDEPLLWWRSATTGSEVTRLLKERNYTNQEIRSYKKGWSAILSSLQNEWGGHTGSTRPSDEQRLTLNDAGSAATQQ